MDPKIKISKYVLSKTRKEPIWGGALMNTHTIKIEQKNFKKCAARK